MRTSQCPTAQRTKLRCSRGRRSSRPSMSRTNRPSSPSRYADPLIPTDLCSSSDRGVVAKVDSALSKSLASSGPTYGPGDPTGARSAFRRRRGRAQSTNGWDGPAAAVAAGEGLCDPLGERSGCKGEPDNLHRLERTRNDSNSRQPD